LCVSGQSVFSRFVKLPPVDKEKVYQIILYEAQQNVPFPMNEVVWDYQLIGRGRRASWM
jgi:type IV pilus assembly protein PilM